MPNFGWDYPPGVSGREYEIAGADYQKEVEGECPTCGKADVLFEEGYKGDHWQFCSECDYQEDLDPVELD